MDNPLLELETLPAFDRIRPEHVVPAVTQVVQESRDRLEELLAGDLPYRWETLIAPLEAQQEKLNRVWSPVSHLNAVANSDELRAAYNACLPELSALETEMRQHQGLYRAVSDIAAGDEFESLDEARKSVIEHRLRDFRLAGVALPDAQRAEYKSVQQRLSELESTFQDNLLDATNAWRKHITDKALLRGIPGSAVERARQTAAEANLSGWVLTLDFPCYQAVLSYADDRPLREEIYTAYVTRASDQGPDAGRWDNSAVMREILSLRQRAAQLVGFENFAARSLAKKMAESPAQVLDFLRSLAKHAKPVAQSELEELREFAASNGADYELQAWDIAYHSEKLREARFAISKESLRPYFPHTRVLEGLFALTGQLFAVRIEERRDVAVWNPEVRFFEIHDEHDTLCGQFYLDLFARPKKRGGAWMGECRTRMRKGTTIDAPVAYLTCNFTPPLNGQPALLTHEEVITLFHEFGHGLHHLLSRIDQPSVSGINGVAWDAVELPSQFLENWCWEPQALAMLSSHHLSGETLPEQLLERMLAARRFQTGMQTVRQLEFALFDMQLHLAADPDSDDCIARTLASARDEVAVLRPPDFNRFAHGFSHVFGGGYAAAYYSYKWAEVLSADAFSLFEERGVLDRETGLSFKRHILEQGGSRDPMALFVAFRGRQPNIDALLRHAGLNGAPA